MHDLASGLSVLTVSTLLTFASVVHATTYKFTDLGTLGGSVSVATAINASGLVVGSSLFPAGNFATHATLWNGTTVTDLGAPGGVSSEARAINASGQVVGNSGGSAFLWNGTTATGLNFVADETGSDAAAINASGRIAGTVWTLRHGTHATVWNGSNVIHVLGTLGGSASLAYGINAIGQVVGQAWTAGDKAGHAAVWDGTAITDLGTLGGIESVAEAINTSGQIAGWSTLPTNLTHATLWKDSNITDLGTLPGMDSSEALAINARGQVVGISFSIGDETKRAATLWNGTTAIDLNSFLDASAVRAGWVLDEATGINDNGWIVGSAIKTGPTSKLGPTHAFLLAPMPVPEPQIYALMLAGLGMVTAIARRTKQT